MAARVGAQWLGAGRVVLLGVLLFWYSTLIPVFGLFQIASISKNSLPLVYLAIGQAIIVIAGGIDLSLGRADADQQCGRRPLYG